MPRLPPSKSQFMIWGWLPLMNPIQLIILCCHWPFWVHLFRCGVFICLWYFDRQKGGEDALLVNFLVLVLFEHQTLDPLLFEGELFMISCFWLLVFFRRGRFYLVITNLFSCRSVILILPSKVPKGEIVKSQSCGILFLFLVYFIYWHLWSLTKLIVYIYYLFPV